MVEQTPFFLIVLIIYFSERGAKWKFLFTFCPSEAKRGEYSATLRRYQEAKPPLDTSRQAARRIHLIISSLFLSYFNVNSLSKSQRKFKELKDSVCLAPFDIYIPNRKNYISYTRLMEKSHQETLLRVYNEGLFNAGDAEDFTSYTNINNAFLGLLDSSILRMNSPNLTDTIQTIIYKEKHAIRRITMNYPALQPFSNWYNSQVDFWDERSEAINKKIWKELNANSNKTILIITGLLHKSDIENYLKRKELASLCTLIPLQEALINPPIADF